jgi:hypothetical protein
MTQAAQQPQQNLIYVTARLSFPNIVDPQTKVNDKGETQTSYNCDLIFPQNDPGFAKFMQTYAAMAQDKWKENAQAAMQRIQSDRKTRCYGDGSEKASQKTFQIHPGYAGNVFISARSSRQPQIIDIDGKPVDPTNTMQLRAVASKLYGGCYVNAVIKPWLQQNTAGIGVRCDLVAIQFNRDGEAFGAGAADVTGFFGAVQGAAPAAPAFMQPQMPAAPFPGAAAPQPPLGMPSFLGG